MSAGVAALLAAYMFEIGTIVSIGRRAAIVGDTEVDCTSPWEARAILATAYALVPLGVLLAKDWDVAGKLFEAAAAAGVALALVLRLVWLLRELRVPDADAAR